MKHSPEPICKKCGEDKPDAIDIRIYPWGVEKFCNTCSTCWLEKA